MTVVVRRRPKPKTVAEELTVGAYAAVRTRLIREEAIRRWAGSLWPEGDAGWRDWCDWCVFADRRSPYSGFDADNNAIHAALIAAVAARRKDRRRATRDLEVLLPDLVLPVAAPTTYRLPPRLTEPARTEPTRSSPLKLDPLSIELIEADSARSAEHLAKTFATADPVASSRSSTSLAPSAGHPPPATAAVLDGAHAQLLQALVGRAQLTKSELTALCAERGLRVAGALELLNEAAYDLCDEPLIERARDVKAGHHIPINCDVLKVMLK